MVSYLRRALRRGNRHIARDAKADLDLSWIWEFTNLVGLAAEVFVCRVSVVEDPGAICADGGAQDSSAAVVGWAHRLAKRSLQKFHYS